MGKLTQWIDYIHRPSEDLRYKDFMAHYYTHFTVNSDAFNLRKELKLYKK